MRWEMVAGNDGKGAADVLDDPLPNHALEVDARFRWHFGP